MMGREIPIANKGASSANPSSENRPDRSDQPKKSYPPRHKQSYEKKKKSK
jgi:hypothetical protein